MLRPSIFISATYATGVLAQAGALAHALVEGAQLLLGVGVVEAEHRHLVLDGRKAVGDAAADALGRRIGGDELGMVGLERFEFVQQAVERLVRDLGRGVDVVLLFVVADGGAKFADAGGGFHGALRLERDLAIAREDVVGKRQQRVALGARRKRVQRLLGAVGELLGAAERVVDRRVLLQAAQQLRPLLGRDGARRDDLADDARRRRRRSTAGAGG